jgi:hypothetical protein
MKMKIRFGGILSPSSGSESKPLRDQHEAVSKQSSAYCLLHAGFLLELLFGPEDEDYIIFRNVGRLSSDYMTLYARKWNSS